MNDRPLKGTGILQAMITMDVIALAALLFAVSAAADPWGWPHTPHQQHQVYGLWAAMLNFVARCVAIFYMLASGRAIKDLVAEHGLDPSYIVRSKGVKRVVETVATLALVPVMVSAIGGGIAHATRADIAPHAAWSWAAVAAAALCLAVDVRAGLKNHALLREADGVVRGGRVRADPVGGDGADA